LAFAPADDDEIRGSGRSIPDVHLRDVLDLVSKRHPGLIRKFGGHAMAAGLTLGRQDFDAFAPAFDAAVQELTGRNHFEPLLETDGSLESGYANAEVATLLQQQVWGARSEEHTSELQSRENLVCRLLLEKKKTNSICAVFAKMW